MVIFKLLFLSYMHTNLYFSFYHTNSVDMLYIVHKYKTKVRIYKYGFDAFVNSDFYKLLQLGGRVVQQFVKCFLPLQFAKCWRFLVTHIVYHKGIKCLLKHS